MPAPLKIGIIGLGFGSQVHVPAFRADPRCQVVAIGGRNAEKAAGVARQLSIGSSYDDWRSMVENPEIDAISVAVPPCEQAAIAKGSVQAGKHIFCEKPLAANGGEAGNLFEAAKAKGIVHGVDFIFPELPLWLKARELIRKGRLGQIRHAVLSWRVETYAAKVKARSWKNDPKQGGGVLNNFVSHVVHNVEWMFGEIGSVNATLRGPKEGAETCVQATLDMRTGFPVFLSVASDAFLGYGHYLAVYGEEGTLALKNRTKDYTSGFELSLGTRETGTLEMIDRDEPQPGVDGRVAPVSRLTSRFVDAIIDGEPMNPNFADGWRTQVVLDEMRASNQRDRSIDKPLAPE